MQIELLYFQGCPSWQAADERLAEVLRSIGRGDVTVKRRPVETPERAEELRFIGSPTIRIDGIDPFGAGDEQVGLACRLYETPTGPSGSPTTTQLLKVLS